MSALRLRFCGRIVRGSRFTVLSRVTLALFLSRVTRDSCSVDLLMLAALYTIKFALLLQGIFKSVAESWIWS